MTTIIILIHGITYLHKRKKSHLHVRLPYLIRRAVIFILTFLRSLNLL